MGMDVYGKAPTDKAGEYFRNNCWWWRPLACYAVEVAPEITSACKYWQSNDGDGLDADGAVKLADALQAEIDAGRTAAREKEYMAELDALPDETCRYCQGTGMRKDMVVANGCNACRGKGTVRPSEASYPFSAENVQEFVNFLRASGGFEIS